MDRKPRPAMASRGEFQPSQRSGTSRVAVIATIVLLLSLFLLIAPAVHSARESARLQHCRNNLKQLGLGLHNYHDQFGCFPPGWVWNNRVAWALSILPNVGSRQFYRVAASSSSQGCTEPVRPQDQRSCSLQHGNPIAANQPVYTTQADYYLSLGATEDFGVDPTFRCPSDIGSNLIGDRRTLPQTEDRPDPLGHLPVGLRRRLPNDAAFPRSNYVGVFGNTATLRFQSQSPHRSPHLAAYRAGFMRPSTTLSQEQVSPLSIQGMFWENSHCSHRDIMDGTTNTLMLGERRSTTIQNGRILGGEATWLSIFDRQGEAENDDRSAALVVGIAGGELSKVSTAESGGSLLSGNIHPEVSGRAGESAGQVVRINSGTNPRSTEPGQLATHWYGFSSSHVGGSHFLLADGSVRFVSDNLDDHILSRLSAMADGNVADGCSSHQ